MARVTLTVTVENLAPQQGTSLTPVWVGFHDSGFDIYNRGESLNNFPGTEELAEDGSIAPISNQFDAVGAGSVQGAVGGAPIAPGTTATQTFVLDSSLESSRYFSYASMILPSNDAFVANGNPLAFEIFDAEGNFLGADFTVLGEQVLDAGTEVNDEIPANTAFLGQEAPQTGVVQTAPVETHPGFIEGGPILEAFPNADFTIDGYEVAQISVSEISTDGDLTTIEVAIANLAPEQGTSLTPVWVGFHDGGFDIYNRGESLNNFPGTEELAEDGSIAPISNQFDAVGAGSVQGAVGGAPIAPGTTATQTFVLDSSLESSRYFSYASMILPSNDAFVANGNPLAFEIFDAEGNFLGADFTVLGEQVLDAGTEVNDEIPANTAFLGQEAPQTGVDQTAPVETHPGFIEGGPILDAFPNADFTADDYEIARITVAATSSLVFGSTANDDLDSTVDDNLDGFGDLLFSGAGADSVDASQGAGQNRLFSGSGNDELFASRGDRINAGSGDDVIDATSGGGDNRLFGDLGDDDFFLGSGDRALGGEGNDRFFVSAGGDTLTGGAGSDQFWVASSEFPDAASIVTDFTSGEDAIGIAGLGASFEQLDLANDGSNAIVGFNGASLAILLGIDAATLTATDFAFA